MEKIAATNGGGGVKIGIEKNLFINSETTKGLVNIFNIKICG